MSYRLGNLRFYFGISCFILFFFISGCLLHHTDDKISKAPLGFLAILFSNSNPYLNSAELYDPATRGFLSFRILSIFRGIIILLLFYKTDELLSQEVIILILNRIYWIRSKSTIQIRIRFKTRPKIF